MHFWRRHPELHNDVKTDDLRSLTDHQVGAIRARIAGLNDWRSHLEGRRRIKKTTLPSEGSHLFALYVQRLDKRGFGVLVVGKWPSPEPPDSAYRLAEARLDERPDW